MHACYRVGGEPVHGANADIIITFGQFGAAATRPIDALLGNYRKCISMQPSAHDKIEQNIHEIYGQCADIHSVRGDSISQIEINWNCIRFAFGNFTNHKLLLLFIILLVPTHTSDARPLN